jgi:glycerol uptake facilitator protein
MTPFLAEFIGTALLILLGNGVVANVVLTGTKGNGGGWIMMGSGSICWCGSLSSL